MNSDTLAVIGTALGNVAGAISEQIRQEGAGALPPFTHLAECLDAEALRVRGEGQAALADALTALRGDVGGVA